jgi:hypothetical protein
MNRRKPLWQACYKPFIEQRPDSDVASSLRLDFIGAQRRHDNVIDTAGIFDYM